MKTYRGDAVTVKTFFNSLRWQVTTYKRSINQAEKLQNQCVTNTKFNFSAHLIQLEHILGCMSHAGSLLAIVWWTT